MEGRTVSMTSEVMEKRRTISRGRSQRLGPMLLPAADNLAATAKENPRFHS
jgi:hypothetical protein